MNRFHEQNLTRADTIIFGRVTYGMMESAWREPARTGVKWDWMDDWMMPFALTIDKIKKYVVSNTLKSVDWNAELVRGDLVQTVQQLKQKPGKDLYVSGLKLAQSMIELNLIDEYEFLVHPRIAGHGPYLFAGLSKPFDLKLVSQTKLNSGAIVMRYKTV